MFIVLELTQVMCYFFAVRQRPQYTQHVGSIGAVADKLLHLHRELNEGS